MERHSETGLKLIKSSHSVEDSVVTNGPDIGPTLDKKYACQVAAWKASPPVGDVPAPSFTGTMYILKDGLAVSRERLAEADSVHVENVRHFLEVRRVARKHKKTVYSKLGAARRMIEDQFTDEDNAFELTGIQSPTSEEPAKLLLQADQAIKRLKSPEFVLPESLFKAVTVDPEGLVSELESDVEVFRKSDAKLRAARREVQKSLKNKNRAVQEHGELFLWTARTFESYYRLAGEPELAAQIRPSGRRPGRRAVEVAEESASGTESAETPASDPGSSDSSASASASQRSASDRDAGQDAVRPAAGEAPVSAEVSGSSDSESPAASG